MSVFVQLTRSELRLFRREPQIVFFSLAFPSILVLIVGSIPAFREADDAIGGLRVIDLYVGIATVLTLATLALQSAPMVLAGYRESGFLRRLATTPARPIALLGAQVAMCLLTALASVSLVLIVGRVVFGVALPRQPAAFLLAFLLTAGAAFAIGLFIAALAPSGKAANAIGTLLFFPAMFFAGLWTPREAFPGFLRDIADLTPLGAGERAVHEATSGSWPAWGALAVLGAYVVVFGVAAARLFRWE
ncbi:ABC transporter permease [Pseudosporangium ferrugineum]|uniref:Transport permease protein n=1 Tax=Pseudosporangium ferrugineum TaxID=439699 RepID=A0A2T0S2P9_9ACTN|nr:ABC transporter permease [Pseudosporangium ferrugineum]PRY27603.1 ABC-2 type transport system permease protein [Pseudosporangium ferrugineum]